MADVDSKLAASLKLAKNNPMFFVFVAQGNEGKLLLDKKKISPKDAVEAKKECGGGTIYKGRCKGEEAKLIFEVGKEVPGTLAALTKKIIKRDAGLTFEVEYRIAADLAAEENQAESPGDGAIPTAVVPPPPSAPPQPHAAHGGAEVLKRLNAMAPSIKAALAGPNKARVQTLFVSVNGLIKKGDFVPANTLLDELEQLIVPSSAPPPPAPPAHGGAEVTKRLNSLLASIKAALAGPNKGRVQALFVSINGLIKSNDFVAARTALDELEPLLAMPATAPAPASTSVPPRPPGPTVPPPPSTSDAALAAEWERRVRALEPKVLAAQKTRAGEAKWMTTFMTAQDLGSDGDFAKSLAILDKLEGMLNAPPKPSESPTGAPISNVALQQSLLAWDAARKKVHADLQKLEQSVLQLFSTDPRFAQVKQKIHKFDAVLGDYAEELRDRLDEAANAPAEYKPELCSEAVAVLKRYRAYLSSDPFIKAVANNKLQPIDVEGVLGRTLDVVAKRLGA